MSNLKKNLIKQLSPEVPKKEDISTTSTETPPIYSPVHRFTGFISTGNAAAAARPAAQQHGSNQRE